MNVDVSLFAYLSQYQPDGLGGRTARPFELADDATVGDVVAILRLPNEPRIMMLNGRHAEDDSALHDGDRLAIFPPVAGG